MSAPAYGYLHSARVHSTDPATGGVYLSGMVFAPGLRWGPVPTCVAGLAPGDRVVAASLGTTRDAVVVVGKVGDRLLGIEDIAGLQAALDAKADDTQISAIDAHLTTVDGTLSSHTTTLGSHTTTLNSHTTTLNSHTSSLTAYGGRLTTLEAQGWLKPVASAAARPTSDLYDGYPIYRTDKRWIETWDAGAAKWRVEGVARVSALADITDPAPDQLAILTTTHVLYRYASATSRWTTSSVSGAIVGGKRLSSADMLPTSGGTEMAVLDTGALDLEPSSQYEIVVELSWQASAASDDFDFRLRADSPTTSGTQLKEGVAPRTAAAYPHFTHFAHVHTTTTVQNGKVFYVTAARVGGSGTCKVVIPSYVRVRYLGPTGTVALT